jgi:hypothetical protein
MGMDRVGRVEEEGHRPPGKGGSPTDVYRCPPLSSPNKKAFMHDTVCLSSPNKKGFYVSI